MASHFFNEADRAFIEGEIDVTSDTLDVILCGTNTTAGTDYDADTVSAIATLDEFDASGYTWGFGGDGRKTLQNVTTEQGGELGIFADPTTWTNLEAGTRRVQGALVVKRGTSDADSVPIAWMEFDDPYPAWGGDLSLPWDTVYGLVRYGNLNAQNNSRVSKPFRRDVLKGEFDLANDTLDAILCMGNFSQASAQEAEFVSDISSLGEADGSGFTWGFGGDGRKQLTATISEVTGDPNTGHAKLDFADLQWASLGACSSVVRYVLVARRGTSDADSRVIGYLDIYPYYTADGSDMDLVFDPDGAFKVGLDTP